MSKLCLVTAAMPAIPFDQFNTLTDAACQERIEIARAALGKKAVLLCHHYQRADIYQHADLTGDSLKLSRLASQTDSDYLIFCGVHFMAEVADIMSRPNQTAILPDLAAVSYTHLDVYKRQEIFWVLKDAPSLAGRLQDPMWIDRFWSNGVAQVITETGLDCFPEACPWSIEGEVLKDGWLPDA